MEWRKNKRFQSAFLDKIYLFDIYYNKVFFKNFLIFSFLFIVVYFFSMLLSSLSELFKRASYNDFVTTKHILTYYFYLIPQYINDTLAFAYLFSMSYTLGVFYRNREILALVSSGVQTFRISFISLLLGFLIGVFLLLANCFFFPPILDKANTYNMKLSLSPNERYVNNVQVRDNDGILYFGQYFLSAENSLQNFLLLKENNQCGETFNLLEETKVIKDMLNKSVKELQKELLAPLKDIPPCFPFDYYIRGEKLTLNEKTKEWEITNFTRSIFDIKNSRFQKIESGSHEVLSYLHINPSAFKGNKKNIDTLTISQALDQMKDLESHLEPTYIFFINMVDKKFLKPFYAFFMGLFAATLGQFFSRRNVFVLSLILSFSIAFGFLILVNMGYSLAKSRSVPLWVGLSFGYVLGVIIFFFLYRRRKT